MSPACREPGATVRVHFYFHAPHLSTGARLPVVGVVVSSRVCDVETGATVLIVDCGTLDGYRVAIEGIDRIDLLSYSGEPR